MTLADLFKSGWEAFKLAFACTVGAGTVGGLALMFGLWQAARQERRDKVYRQRLQALEERENPELKRLEILLKIYRAYLREEAHMPLDVLWELETLLTAEGYYQGYPIDNPGDYLNN